MSRLAQAIVVLVLASTGVTFAQETAAPTAAAPSAAASAGAGDPVAGATVFKKCMACHRIGANARNAVGPELNGLIGRKSASLPDYSYSSAMQKAGLTWDEATLFPYLHSPRAVVPGTKMSFAGLASDKDVANVIAYLGTFDPDGKPAAQ